MRSLIPCWLSAAAILAVSFPASGGLQPSDVDAENGFQGIKFGTSLNSLPQDQFKLTFSAADGRYKKYHRPSDKLQYEGTPVEEIAYYFWDDRFRLAIVKFKDEQTLKIAILNLSKRYETGTIEPGSSLFNVQGALENFQLSDIPDYDNYCILIRSAPLQRLFDVWKNQGPYNDLREQGLP